MDLFENKFVIENGVLKEYQGEDEIVRVPDSVTVIGEHAFENPRTADAILDHCEETDSLIPDQAFETTKLTTVIIPDSVTTIGEHAFHLCLNLANVIFGNGVTVIKNFAFWSCCRLESIVIPDGADTIGGLAFAYCTALKSITIPASVTVIGMSCFEYCTKLTIHAPSGSYAEHYAKENNIPFVAE